MVTGLEVFRGAPDVSCWEEIARERRIAPEMQFLASAAQ
jgi:hypothetical protein